MSSGLFGEPYDFVEGKDARFYDCGIQSRIKSFPFLYTLVSLFVIFGGGLLILQLAGETTTWAIFTTFALFIMLGVWVISHEIRFTLAYIRKDVVGETALYQFFDVVLALFLVFAAIWFNIYTLDNTQFLRVPGGSAYRKFIGFWHASSLFSATIGFSVTVPVGAAAELWGIFMAFHVIWLFVAVFSGAATERLYMKNRDQIDPYLLSKSSIHDNSKTQRGEVVGGVRVAERKGKRKGKKTKKYREHNQQGKRKPVNNPVRLVQIPNGKWRQSDSGPVPSLLVNSKKKN